MDDDTRPTGPARPTPDEFRAAAREAFGFLVADHGFREERVARGSHNPVAVWFVNDTTRVVVEGINYGRNARVAVGRAGPIRSFENNDLGDLASVRRSDLALTDEQVEVERAAGQLGQIPRLAELLRACGAEVLRGEFSSFPAIHALRERRAEEWERANGWSARRSRTTDA